MQKALLAIPTSLATETQPIDFGRVVVAPVRGQLGVMSRTGTLAALWVSSRTATRSSSPRRFFYADRSFDRAWMYIEPKLFADPSRELASADRSAWYELSMQERQHLALHPCGPGGPRFLGTSPAIPASSKLTLAW